MKEWIICRTKIQILGMQIPITKMVKEYKRLRNHTQIIRIHYNNLCGNNSYQEVKAVNSCPFPNKIASK